MKIGQRIRCKSTSMEGVVTKVDGKKIHFRSVDGCIRSRHVSEVVVSYYRTRVPLMEKKLADLERRLARIQGFCRRYTNPSVVNSTAMLAQHVIELSRGEICEPY